MHAPGTKSLVSATYVYVITYIYVCMYIHKYTYIYIYQYKYIYRNACFMLAKRTPARGVQDFWPIVCARFLCKLYACLSAQRIGQILDAAEPKELIGFRAGRRLEEHLLTTTLLLEKSSDGLRTPSERTKGHHSFNEGFLLAAATAFCGALKGQGAGAVDDICWQRIERIDDCYEK
jgi:hypothetical protein